MTDTLISQFKTSLKWSKCIRQTYPTMLFYFTQTYDQTIVIYCLEDDGTIKTVYTKLTVDAVTSCSDLPSALQIHFKLEPQGSTMLILPGMTDRTPWEMSNGKLVQGDRVLVSTTGVVNEVTQELECVYLIYVNKKTRQLEWDRMECTDEVKTLISDLKNGLWTTLKSVIGGYK
jgi:hypothetical protein